MSEKVRECEGCRFCCWSFTVHDVPRSSDFTILQSKPALTHCSHECESGCSIHGADTFPLGCKVFLCPYLAGDEIHRPDTFQYLLESMNITVCAFVPAVPKTIPVEEANDLITRTRTIMAATADLYGYSGQWVRVVMPLDLEKNGQWYLNKDLLPPWISLCAKYGVNLAQRNWGASSGKNSTV